MNRAQIQENFIVQYEQPFWKFINGIWSRTTGSFEYRQEYNRDDENPLDTFLSQANTKLNEFLLSYYYTMGAAIGNNFKNTMINFFNDFLSEFEDNMNTINNTYDEWGNPIYDGGETIGRFTLNTTAAISERTIIREKDLSKYRYNPQFIFKYNLISLRSQRW